MHVQSFWMTCHVASTNLISWCSDLKGVEFIYIQMHVYLTWYIPVLQLYRVSFLLWLLQLSRGCAFQVRRIMHQRAISVHLEPRIEEPCLKDLASFCTDAASEQGKVSTLWLFQVDLSSQEDVVIWADIVWLMGCLGLSCWVRPVILWVCCTRKTECLGSSGWVRPVIMWSVVHRRRSV